MTRIRDRFRGSGLFALLAVSAGAFGCGSVVEPSEGAGIDGISAATENVAQVSSALTLGCRTDPKGYLTSCIYQCGWSAYSTSTNSATCSVPSGYVLTGGGAEIEDQANPGALLTGSYYQQTPKLKTWIASSSAPLGTSIKHRIRAYAIGLKIKNVTEANLRNGMQIAWNVANVTEHNPTFYLWNDGLGQAIGGGATQYGSPGQFLTRSETISSLEFWRAESKDHGTSARGDIQAFLLEMPQQFPNVPYILRPYLLENCSFVNSGYAAASFNSPATDLGVLVSIGADNTFNGAGRMLADMIPTGGDGVQSVFARSKDHGTADSGDVCAQGVFLRADSGTPGPGGT